MLPRARPRPSGHTGQRGDGHTRLPRDRHRPGATLGTGAGQREQPGEGRADGERAGVEGGVEPAQGEWGSEVHPAPAGGGRRGGGRAGEGRDVGARVACDTEAWAAGGGKEAASEAGGGLRRFLLRPLCPYLQWAGCCRESPAAAATLLATALPAIHPWERLLLSRQSPWHARTPHTAAEGEEEAPVVPLHHTHTHS